MFDLFSRRTCAPRYPARGAQAIRSGTPATTRRARSSGATALASRVRMKIRNRLPATAQHEIVSPGSFQHIPGGPEQVAGASVAVDSPGRRPAQWRRTVAPASGHRAAQAAGPGPASRPGRRIATISSGSFATVTPLPPRWRGRRSRSWNSAYSHRPPAWPISGRAGTRPETRLGCRTDDLDRAGAGLGEPVLQTAIGPAPWPRQRQVVFAYLAGGDLKLDIEPAHVAVLAIAAKGRGPTSWVSSVASLRRATRSSNPPTASSTPARRGSA